MKLKDLCSYLDSEVPLSFQESYDNSGLQVGMPESEIKSALLTLDVTEEVLEEAISKKCDVVISHHPVIFGGIKKIAGRNMTERVLSMAIKNDIAIYSSHTSLDVVSNGVSRKMAEKLDLTNVRILKPLEKRIFKLVTFIPESHLDTVRQAIFNAGAGVIGNYDQCGYASSGMGSFRGDEKSKPFAGQKGKIHFEKEIRLETVMYSHLKEDVINALLRSHPYEEVAYDIYSLENNNGDIGMGCTGMLKEEMPETDFLKLVSDVFNAKGIRYSNLTGKMIKNIALCGGSAISLLPEAISSGADTYITADIKYHNFFDADRKILLIDTGHFESEKFSTEILYDLVIKKFPKFAVRFSETNTNPINYL
jgi:dinuclear metal center YbgI/SA1388 family protein